MNICKWLNKKFPEGLAHYNVCYVITHPWIILVEWKNQLRWAWQRVFRGWDDRATWSIDYYLAKLLPQLLRKLKEVKHGIPIVMFDNDFICTDEDEKIAEEKWNNILDKIANDFEDYIEDDRKNLDEAFELFKTYFSNLWD